MTFVIDTSSAQSGVALLDRDATVVSERVHESGRTFDLPATFREIVGDQKLTRIAVAIGPGSFTGLRVGVSFGLGLATGLAVPIVALRTLHLQAARSDVPAMAVAEAGRGRVYFLVPGSEPALAEAPELPRHLPLVGWVRRATEVELLAAGQHFRAEKELRSFGAAASLMLESAREVAYGSLRLEYMQAFSKRA